MPGNSLRLPNDVRSRVCIWFGLVMVAETRHQVDVDGAGCVSTSDKRVDGLSAGDLGAFVVGPAEGSAVSARNPGSGSGSLAGMKIPIKDNIDVAGWPTGAGSGAPIAAAESDAIVVASLRAAGAAVGPKTALDEFAMTTFGPGMRNPYDLDRSVGGSSGGSALAVAAGEFCVALGTDTGGSVRIPASYCGVVGFKPTYAQIPTTGVVPLSSTLDHVGLLGCSVAMISRVFDACRTHRPSSRPKNDGGRKRYWPTRLSDLHIGRCDVAYLSAANDEVSSAVELVSGLFRDHGLQVDEVALPAVRDVLHDVHYPIAAAEAAAYHTSRYGDLRDHSETVRAVIDAGLSMSAPDYVQTLHGLDRIRADFGSIMADFDVLLLPTTPTSAPLRGAGSTELGDGEVVDALDASIWYTSLFNDVGAPAISLPFRDSRLPFGVQLAAAPGDDDLLLFVSHILESLLEDLVGVSS